ncbi:methionine adenosyltransferase domain-containing protein, partial [Campylobacter jejuni]|nr:methionine adenosyltransferase domain-containing protein [Campylobacter jejuni]
MLKKCIVQLSYAIGVAKPTSEAWIVWVQIPVIMMMFSDFVMQNFSLTPNWIRDKFHLDKPSKETFLYADVAARGQVGQKD